MLFAFSKRREDSKMSKIKNNSQGRKRNSLKTSVVIFIPLLLILFGGTLAFGDVTPSSGLDNQINKVLLKKVFKIQMPFIANQGQIPDEHVRFYAKTFGGTVFVTDQGEMVYSFSMTEPKPPQSSMINPRDRHLKPGDVKVWTLREKLIGSFEIMPKATDKAETKANYFIGNDKSKWKTDITTYNEVSLGEIYKGIDLKLKAYGKTVEKIFTVKPGSDPNAINLKIEGANSLNINDKGELEVEMGFRPVSFAKPIAYQEIKGKRHEVKVAYTFKNSTPDTQSSMPIYGFKVDDYDKSYALVIDPIMVPALGYSTYLGGSNTEEGNGIAVDSSGNAYIAGSTLSTDFPTFPKPASGGIPIQPNFTGVEDAFVTKVNPAGSLVYSTYLGGINSSRGFAIAVDSSGSAYLTGTTSSSDFPTTANAYQMTFGGVYDAFVTKINPDGTLAYSTYLGGNGTEDGYGIAVDSSGSAYITGDTSSSTFPLMNPIQSSLKGTWDAFVTKINPAGSALVYSTYLGGTGTDYGNGIAVDSSGSAYTTGTTSSSEFPTTVNAYQMTFGGVDDAFVTKINPDGTLAYSTYLGGNGIDHGYGIAVDSSGSAYITGVTESSNFPTKNAYQPTFGGAWDAFVTKMNPAGSALVYSTYLGGSGNDFGNGIAVDGCGSAYITGQTASSNFPIANAIQSTYAGGLWDAFVTKMNPSASALVYSTYLGGSSTDSGASIAVDSSGNAYIIGQTDSLNFPTTAGAFQPALKGSSDVFVAKIEREMIDRTVWADLEFVREINNGVLESALRRYGSNGSNYLQFYDPSTINSFSADVKVTDYQNNGAYPHASLLGRVYQGLYNSVMGDIIGIVGIGHNPTKNRLEGFWSISRCTTAACNLPSEYDQICTGSFDDKLLPSLNTTYPLSFAWYGSGSSTFTFGIGGFTKDISVPDCIGLPADTGLPPQVNTRGIGTRVAQISGLNEGGYIFATFDNVKINGPNAYDNFDSSNMIDPTKWKNWEFVREASCGGELLSELTQWGVNGTNNMSFVNSQIILGFGADLKVLNIQNNNARPLGRLYAALYNDGTGSGTPGDLTGDVIASIGILEQSSYPVPPALAAPRAFYAVSRCLAPDCNLPGEYQFLTSGDLGPVNLNETHHFSVSWDGSQLTFGFDSSSLPYLPTVPVAGPPKGRKGIGTRVTEIDDSSKWAYIAASLDNVVVLSIGYPLTVTKSGTGTGTVTSSPSGINCGSDCGQGYLNGTPVTLTAAPDAGSNFSGWSGACTGTDPCNLTIDSPKNVTATFLPAPPVQTFTISGTITAGVYPVAGVTLNGLPGNPPVTGDDGTYSATVDSRWSGTVTPTKAGYKFKPASATYINVQSSQTQDYVAAAAGGPPFPPDLDSPPNNSTGVSVTPTLSWIASTGAGYYGLQVATDQGFSPLSIMVNQTVFSATSYTVGVPLVNGITYYWRVYAADIDLGASDWSVIWHFTTVAAPAGPPAPPTLVSPNNGQTQVPTNPTLTWNASSGATSYQLQVSTSSTFSTTVFDQSGIGGTSQPVVGLSNGTTYYWHVEATGANGTSDFSATWSFITQAAFGVPFIGAGGMLDPDWDLEVDGIDDAFEVGTIKTDPTKKTIFIRPKIEIAAPDPTTGFEGAYQYWADFKDKYFQNSPPGRANIPPFTNANVEVVVVGDPTNPYPPMQQITYAPAADPNFTANAHYGCDIIDIIFRPNAYSTSANVNYGHTSFDSTYAAGPRWVWDTKGFTSPGGQYGYGKVEIYGLPHENYFNEGAYLNISVNQTPQTASGGPPTCIQCYQFGNKSPMNLSGTTNYVEFNTISFNKASTPKGAITSVGAKGTDYDRVHVYGRTIAHELGHALGMAHCNNPACIMNGDSTDWEMKNFGTGGKCTHDPNLLIHNGPATPRAPFLVYPVKGATINPNPNPSPITLTWNPSPGAASYQLQVSAANTSNFKTTLVDVTLNATSYAVTIPKTGNLATTYYWQVRGCNVIGGASSCGPWQPSTPTPQFFKTN